MLKLDYLYCINEQLAYDVLLVSKNFLGYEALRSKKLEIRHASQILTYDRQISVLSQLSNYYCKGQHRVPSYDIFFYSYVCPTHIHICQQHMIFLVDISKLQIVTQCSFLILGKLTRDLLDYLLILGIPVLPP